MQIRKNGAKALVIFKGKFVMVQRDNDPNILNPGKWNLPGGGIDGNETPEEALVRELHEEINLVPTCIEPMGITRYTDGDAVVHRYAVRPTPEELANIHLVSEGQELRWFTLPEALTMDLSVHLRAYFEEYSHDILSTLSGKTVARDVVIDADVLA
jgi:8-oxo-dGTP diphosphatase